jgi:hypothetical protein
MVQMEDCILSVGVESDRVATMAMGVVAPVACRKEIQDYTTLMRRLFVIVIFVFVWCRRPVLSLPFPPFFFMRRSLSVSTLTASHALTHSRSFMPHCHCLFTLLRPLTHTHSRIVYNRAYTHTRVIVHQL